MVNPIPDEYPRVSPYLVVDGAAEAINFYKSVLGATEPGPRMEAPGGKIGHAELRLGDSVIMIADPAPDYNAHPPGQFGGSPIALMVYVEDVDDVFKRAIEAGAKEERPLTDEFYGDRMGTFEDPFGHRWHVATHIEDVSPKEMEKRMADMTAAG